MSSDSYSNGSVEKTFLILETLAAWGEPLSLTRLADETDINKATLFRFLSVLSRLGYVWKSVNGEGYSIGTRFLQLGRTIPLPQVVKSVARPFLDELATKTSESIQIGLLEGDKVFYCDKIEGGHNLRMSMPPGMMLDAHCTGLGKAMLALRPSEEVERLYAGRTLKAFTLNTQTTLEGLVAELAKVRASGYALNNEEFEAGLRCIAVAATLPTIGRDIAISVSGPVFRMSDDVITRIIPLVRTAITAIAATLERAGKPPEEGRTMEGLLNA